MVEHLHFYPGQEKTPSFRPRVMFSGTLRGGPMWANGKHRHNFCEIMYVTEGTGVVIIENREYAIAAGDIVVYNSGVFHEERCTGEALDILFFAMDHIKIPGMADGCMVPGDSSPVIDAGPYGQILADLLPVMVGELEQKEDYYRAIATSIASLFCYYILRLCGIRIKTPDQTDTCVRVKQYIDEHYQSELNLDELAAGMHLSKYYLIHLFKEGTGMPPMKYLTFVRMLAAKDNLARTKDPIGTIAAQVGYENALTFSRVFKNSEGISPSEYRKRVIHN